MRNFIATADAIVGEIELRYDMRNMLCAVIIRAELELTVLQWIAKYFPFTVEHLAAWKQYFTITEIAAEVTFEVFWDNWPENKIDRARAVKVWERMSIKDKTRAISVLGAYKRYCQRNAYKNPKSPAAWLSERKFDNDYNKA